MGDQAELAAYVEVWWQSVADFTAVLEQVPDEQWTRPTDLAGWDVRACAAHTAHLERVLATGVEEQAEVGEPAHVTGLMGRYTEIGVLNRLDHTPDQVVAEIREMTTLRHDALLSDPPTDGSAMATNTPGGAPWSWRTLLRNRPLDVWMHEQDVRRAVGHPGGLDSPAAVHSADYLAQAFGFVLAKKAGAAPGTTAVLDVAGHPTYAFIVDDAGRGQPLDSVPAAPDLHLAMDREAFVLLAGGRRGIDGLRDRVEVGGSDPDLAETVLTRMATTP